MANTHKFKVKNGLQGQNISFVDDVENPSNTIEVSMLTNDVLSFSGNAGQLFSISDSMTGTIFAVNDVSGVPAIEVDDDGTIRLAESFGNVLIGTNVDDGVSKLQLNGSLNIFRSNNVSTTDYGTTSHLILDNDGSQTKILFRAGNTNYGGIRVSSSGNFIFTAGSTAFYFNYDSDAGGANVSGSFNNSLAASWLTWNGTAVTIPGTLAVTGGITGSLSGTASNANLLDNLDSTQFLRSDVDDTLTGTLTVRRGDTGNILVSENTSASNASQFYIKHNYADVLMQNIRGNVGIQNSIYTTTGWSAFAAGGIDPDSFHSYAGGFGSVQDGSGWAAPGMWQGGGGTGKASAIATASGYVYFGSQDGVSDSSMKTWLQLTQANGRINFNPGGTFDPASTIQFADRTIPVISNASTAPSTNREGDLWWDTVNGVLKVWYNDGSSTQWVDAIPVVNTSTFYPKSGGNISGAVTMSSTLDVTGNVTIDGNLTVNGSTTTLNSTTLTVDDLNIVVASGAGSAAAANGAGLTVDGASATLTYTSGDDRWNFNKNLNVSTVYGNLVGNVTGSVTGASSLNVLKAGDTMTGSLNGAVTNLSGNGDNNQPFRFSSDFSSWAIIFDDTWTSTNGWGIFWAGNSGAAYGTNGANGPGNIWSNSTNPNEMAFVGSGATRWSIHLGNGNTWQQGDHRIRGQLGVGSDAIGAAGYGDLYVDSDAGNTRGATIRFNKAQSWTSGSWSNNTLWLINGNNNDYNYSSIGLSTYGSDGENHRAIIAGYRDMDNSSQNAAGKLAFITRGTGAAYIEQMTIDSLGNVGIGNNNPSDKFEVHGSNGMLFAVTDDMTGTIFSVSDISGIPSIEVDASGEVRLAEFTGNVLIGTTADNGNKLQVNGGVSATTFTGALAGNADTASRWATARTLTLGGDASGSVAFDGSGNISLTVTVADNSHSHSNYALKAGDTFTGNVNIETTGGAALTLKDTNGAGIAAATYIDFDDSAGTRVGYVGMGSGSNGYNYLYAAAGSPVLYSGNASSPLYMDGTNTHNIFHDAYHPNADTWTTARTITLSGDASGSVSINGSANVTLSVTVADNSHNHTIIYREDDRILEPVDHGNGYMKYYFTSWNNNNTSPYADALGMQSYTDASGGDSNLVMFLKSGIGARIWQQSWNSSSAYASYRDVMTMWDSNSAPTANVHSYPGQFWFDTNSLTLKYRYNDGTSVQWVDAIPIPDVSSKYDKAGGSITGAVSIGSQLNVAGDGFFEHEVLVGDGSQSDSRIILKSNNTSTADEIQFYQGTTRVGEIGTTDTSWLRINQNTAKNIYTPRYIRADGGFYAGSTWTLDGSRNFNLAGGTISGDLSMGGQITNTTANEGARFYNLHLGYGTLYNTIWSSENLHLRANTSSAGSDNGYGGNIFIADSGGGEVRVGPSAPTGAQLTVAGNIIASGTITAQSDARLKTNVETVENGLDKVSKMRGVTYERPDLDNEKGAGVIAQELQQVAPELVNENSEYLTVNYSGIIAYLIESIKELKQEIDELKNKE